MAKETKDIAATFKLLLIGDSGTGKSSILLRFTDDTWLQPDEVSATIGVDFKVKVLDVDEKRYKLTIWDTAGQERFRTLTSSYYRGAQGVILVYDVSNRASFEHLQLWFAELETYASSKDVIKIIVGNKCDKEMGGGREVSRKEGEAFAKKLSTIFIETSAKTTTGVKDAFVEVVRKIVETPQLWRRTSLSQKPGTLNIANPDEEVPSTCNCEYVTLIPYKRQHVLIYHEWMKDSYLQEMTASDSLSLSQEYEMQESWSLDPTKCTFIISLPGFHKNHVGKHAIIGDVNIYFNDYENPTGVEIEVMIAETECRGKGLGKDALKLMMYYAVSDLNVSEFTAKISLKNEASIRLFKSLGFVAFKTSDIFQELEMKLKVTPQNQSKILNITAIRNIWSDD